MLIDLFKEQFISLLNFGHNYFVQLRRNWFSVRLPITNACYCNLLYTAFSSNVERGVCELAHSFFYWIIKWHCLSTKQCFEIHELFSQNISFCSRESSPWEYIGITLSVCLCKFVSGL